MTHGSEKLRRRQLANGVTFTDRKEQKLELQKVLGKFVPASMTPKTQFFAVPLVYETGTKRQQYIREFMEKVKVTKTQNKGETEMKKKPSLNIFVTLLLT